MEAPKAKSRSSSITSTPSKSKRELVSFKDVVSGNVSEDVLRASTLAQPQEKVYELEHVEGSCQTPDLSAVNIAPITYLTLSAAAINSLRDVSHMQTCAAGVGEHVQTCETPASETTTLPPAPAEESLRPFPERSEIIKLMKTVTEDSKQFRQKLGIVKDRRQLKAEQKADEEEARQMRNAKMEKKMSEYNATVDEARVLLDNLVTHFQSLSSRYNSECVMGV